MLCRLSNGLAVAGAVACALLTAAVLTSSTVHADGAVGNGGAPGGGGADSIATSYGYGWYQFAVDAAVHPRNGAFTTPWDDINETCRSLGAKSIVTYVVYRPSGGLGNSVVFNYPGWPDNWAGAHGNDGFPWMTVGQAKAKYDSVDADKTGYTWGANVGWFCYDFSLGWGINGQSWIEKGATPNKARATGKSITATVGERLNWYHDLRNTGPDAMERQVFHVIDKTGFTGSWVNNQPTGWASGVRNNLFVRIYATESDPYTRYTVTQNDVGKSLCQRIAWRDRASDAVGQWGRAGYACANIPYSYQLTPSMTVNPSTVIEPGEDTMSVDAMMRNTGSTKSRQVSSMTTRIIIPKGTSLPSTITTSTYTGSDITQAACAYFNVPGRKACTVQARNVVGHVFAANSNTQLPAGRYDDTISGLNLEVGDRLCYVASVNQYSASTPASGWRHSPVRCVEVAKSPKVQIKGGDLMVGRNLPGGSGGLADAEVATSLTTKTIGAEKRVFGSWMEFGIFAPGAVQASSGAAIAGATGGDLTMQTAKIRNPLTFENSIEIGKFSDDMGTMGDLRAQFNVPASNCGGAALASRDGVYNCTNALSLSGNIPTGKTVVMQAPRITITGNITYSSGQITSLAEMPQLVLIANEIVIEAGVTNVDAWLVSDAVANGTIVTCPDAQGGAWMPTSYVTGSGGTRGLTASICANTLQVNGPTMANKLFLRRTAGSDTGANGNDPAEIFNLRADAYLWATQYGVNNEKITTTYTRELAPRF